MPQDLETGGDVQISTINIVSDGLHLNVNHKNHGMYFADNSVILSGVAPDVKPTTLTAEYPSDSTDGITVALASNFETFEKVSVGTTNTGYLLIGDEIIEYTSVMETLLVEILSEELIQNISKRNCRI